MKVVINPVLRIRTVLNICTAQARKSASITERIIATTTRAEWAMVVRVWVYFIGSKGSMTGVDVGFEYCCFYFSGLFTLRHLEPNCRPPLPTAHHRAYKTLAQTATRTTTGKGVATD